LRGRDLEVDLVGLELDQGLADVDGVPFLLQPLRDARVDDRLADLRDYYIRGHTTPDPLSTLPDTDDLTQSSPRSRGRGVILFSRKALCVLRSSAASA
jgi:hypothetical protein